MNVHPLLHTPIWKHALDYYATAHIPTGIEEQKADFEIICRLFAVTILPNEQVYELTIKQKRPHPTPQHTQNFYLTLPAPRRALFVAELHQSGLYYLLDHITQVMKGVTSFFFIGDYPIWLLGPSHCFNTLSRLGFGGVNNYPYGADDEAFPPPKTIEIEILATQISPALLESIVHSLYKEFLPLFTILKNCSFSTIILSAAKDYTFEIGGDSKNQEARILRLIFRTKTYTNDSIHFHLSQDELKQFKDPANAKDALIELSGIHYQGWQPKQLPLPQYFTIHDAFISDREVKLTDLLIDYFDPYNANPTQMNLIYQDILAKGGDCFFELATQCFRYRRILEKLYKEQETYCAQLLCEPFAEATSPSLSASNAFCKLSTEPMLPNRILSAFLLVYGHLLEFHGQETHQIPPMKFQVIDNKNAPMGKLTFADEAVSIYFDGDLLSALKELIHYFPSNALSRTILKDLDHLALLFFPSICFNMACVEHRRISFQIETSLTKEVYPLGIHCLHEPALENLGFILLCVFGKGERNLDILPILTSALPILLSKHLHPNIKTLILHHFFLFFFECNASDPLRMHGEEIEKIFKFLEEDHPNTLAAIAKLFLNSHTPQICQMGFVLFQTYIKNQSITAETLPTTLFFLKTCLKFKPLQLETAQTILQHLAGTPVDNSEEIGPLLYSFLDSVSNTEDNLEPYFAPLYKLSITLILQVQDCKLRLKLFDAFIHAFESKFKEAKRFSEYEALRHILDSSAIPFTTPLAKIPLPAVEFARINQKKRYLIRIPVEATKDEIAHALIAFLNLLPESSLHDGIIGFLASFTPDISNEEDLGKIVSSYKETSNDKGLFSLLSRLNRKEMDIFEFLHRHNLYNIVQIILKSSVTRSGMFNILLKNAAHREFKEEEIGLNEAKFYFALCNYAFTTHPNKAVTFIKRALSGRTLDNTPAVYSMSDRYFKLAQLCTKFCVKSKDYANAKIILDKTDSFFPTFKPEVRFLAWQYFLRGYRKMPLKDIVSTLTTKQMLHPNNSTNQALISFVIDTCITCTRLRKYEEAIQLAHLYQLKASFWSKILSNLLPNDPCMQKIVEIVVHNFSAIWGKDSERQYCWHLILKRCLECYPESFRQLLPLTEQIVALYYPPNGSEIYQKGFAPLLNLLSGLTKLAKKTSKITDKELLHLRHMLALLSNKTNDTRQQAYHLTSYLSFLNGILKSDDLEIFALGCRLIHQYYYSESTPPVDSVKLIEHAIRKYFFFHLNPNSESGLLLNKMLISLLEHPHHCSLFQNLNRVIDFYTHFEPKANCNLTLCEALYKLLNSMPPNAAIFPGTAKVYLKFIACLEIHSAAPQALYIHSFLLHPNSNLLFDPIERSNYAAELLTAKLLEAENATQPKEIEEIFTTNLPLIQLLTHIGKSFQKCQILIIKALFKLVTDFKDIDAYQRSLGLVLKELAKTAPEQLILLWNQSIISQSEDFPKPPRETSNKKLDHLIENLNHSLPTDKYCLTPLNPKTPERNCFSLFADKLLNLSLSHKPASNDEYHFFFCQSYFFIHKFAACPILPISKLLFFAYLFRIQGIPPTPKYAKSRKIPLSIFNQQIEEALKDQKLNGRTRKNLFSHQILSNPASQDFKLELQQQCHIIVKTLKELLETPSSSNFQDALNILHGYQDCFYPQDENWALESAENLKICYERLFNVLSLYYTKVKSTTQKQIAYSWNVYIMEKLLLSDVKNCSRIVLNRCHGMQVALMQVYHAYIDLVVNSADIFEYDTVAETLRRFIEGVITKPLSLIPPADLFAFFEKALPITAKASTGHKMKFYLLLKQTYEFYKQRVDVKQRMVPCLDRWISLLKPEDLKALQCAVYRKQLDRK